MNSRIPETSPERPFEPQIYPLVCACIIAWRHFDQLDYKTISERTKIPEVSCRRVVGHALAWGLTHTPAEYDLWVDGIYMDFFTLLESIPARNQSNNPKTSDNHSLETAKVC